MIFQLIVNITGCTLPLKLYFKYHNDVLQELILKNGVLCGECVNYVTIL